MLRVFTAVSENTAPAIIFPAVCSSLALSRDYVMWLYICCSRGADTRCQSDIAMRVPRMLLWPPLGNSLVACARSLKLSAFCVHDSCHCAVAWYINMCGRKRRCVRSATACAIRGLRTENCVKSCRRWTWKAYFICAINVLNQRALGDAVYACESWISSSVH